MTQLGNMTGYQYQTHMDKPNLTWILQSNAIGEADQALLSECILKLGHRLECLRVIPFVHEPADRMPKIDGRSIVYGSSGLVKIGRKANWWPCGWDGDAFELDVINQFLGNLALNSSATKTVWSQVFEVASRKGWKTVFVRPASETKEFPGQVFEIDQLKEWVLKLKIAGYFKENDNSAMIGPALNLGREWRMFIVGGLQVSGCQYAEEGILQSDPFVPTEVVDFIEQTLQIFSPAPCFVVDVAEVVAGDTTSLKVVEYNSINSAGFYMCDTPKIVKALSEFALGCDAA